MTPSPSSRSSRSWLIKPDDYQRIRVDLLNVVTKAIKVADQAAADQPLFAETFHKFPMQAITKLETYA